MQIAKLSFCPDDEEEEGDEEDEDEADRKKEEELKIEARKMEESKKGFRMVKNPDVDTSFLPDREREDAENRLREELRQVNCF